MAYDTDELEDIGVENPEKKLLGAYPRPNIPQPAGAGIPEAPPISFGTPPIVSPVATNEPPPVKPPQRPTAADYPANELHGGKKALGLLFTGLGAWGNPQLGQSISHSLFEQPKIDAQNKLKEAQGEYDTELQQGETQRKNKADIEEKEAKAKKDAQPPKKTFENIQQLHAEAVQDAIANGVDPAKDPKVQQIEDSIQRIQKEAPQKTGNDFDKYYAQWLKDNKQQDTAANQLKAHKEWETQGGKEAQGTWMPLYDEKGRVVGAWNAATGQHRASPPDALPGHTAPGAHIASTADAATEKKIAPLRAVVEEADKAATLKDMADKGNAEADVDLALTFFKTMRSATQGGSGIRFTQQENNLIMDARNIWGTLEVKGNKLFSNGQPLSKEQRQQILDVINVHRAAAQRQLDEMKQGSNGAPPAAASEDSNDPLGILPKKKQ
jgi:hypothetical protein